MEKIKIFKKTLLLLSFCLFLSHVFAQGVSINTDGSQAHESAILDIESNSSGILFPRMTTTERDNISNPANSLFIFNTTTECFEAYNTNTQNWHMLVCIGEEPEPDLPIFVNCGDNFADIRDANIYTSVKIGNQCWMAENLKYLPSVVGVSTGSDTELYYYVYAYNGTNVNDAKATENYQIYGVLYNWPAAMQACPSGWHLPSHDEWTQLTDYVFTQTDWLCYAGLGSTNPTIVKALAAKEKWSTQSPIIVCGVGADLSLNNKSGFSGLPGGQRNYADNTFKDLTEKSFWWSSTQEDDFARYRGLKHNSNTVQGIGPVGNSIIRKNGLSVRCIKD